jgi:hypothetical protein
VVARPLEAEFAETRSRGVSQTHGFDPNEVFAHYNPNHVPGDPRTSSYSFCDSQE